jgi:hypothetical protein
MEIGGFTGVPMLVPVLQLSVVERLVDRLNAR